jgi:hypothetical protein
MSVTKCVLAGALVAYLVSTFFRNPPPHLSWPMFSRLQSARPRLRARSEEGWVDIDHWEHLQVFNPQMSLMQVDALLSYLSTVHGLSVWGTVEYEDDNGAHQLRVIDGQLDI